MPKHLISSDASIKAIKQGDLRQRVNDGAGLYLRLFVNGGSHSWRFDYSLNGRRNTLSFGTYPVTSLAFARRQADEARRKVREGIDPALERKEVRAEVTRTRAAHRLAKAGHPPVDSFEQVAREWFEKHSPNWAASHSAAWSAMYFLGLVRLPLGPSHRKTCWRFFGELRKGAPSKLPIACSKTVGRCSATPSPRGVSRSIPAAICAAR